MNRVEVTGAPPTIPGRSLGETFTAETRPIATEAGEAALNVVRAGAPGGFSGEDMTKTVRRTADGTVIRVAPIIPKRHIASWVNKGTGVFGPKRRPIRRRAINPETGLPKPFELPGGGFVEEIQGQKPNPFIDRHRAQAAAAVERVLIAGGRRAFEATAAAMRK